jgi:hypothetical protein
MPLEEESSAPRDATHPLVTTLRKLPKRGGGHCWIEAPSPRLRERDTDLLRAGRGAHPPRPERTERAKTLSRWHDECPPDRGRNPRCFNGLPYHCGFPQITIVCQQIRGHSVRVFLDLAARRRARRSVG